MLFALPLLFEEHRTPGAGLGSTESVCRAEPHLEVVVERFARFVLRHRLVVVLAGSCSSSRRDRGGPVTDRLTFDFSLPGQPGYEAEQQLIETSAPAPPTPWCRCSPCPRASTVPTGRDDIAGVFEAVRTGGAAGPAWSTTSSTGDDRLVTDDGRSTFALVQGPLPQGFGPGIEAQLQPGARAGGRAPAGLHAGLDVVRAAGRRAATPTGPSVLAETLFGARRRAGRAAVRVRVVPGARAAAHRGGVDPHHVPARARPDDLHRRQLRRAVPHRADRPGRRDRLLAAAGLALAGGAGARPRQRGGRRRSPCRPPGTRCSPPA